GEGSEERRAKPSPRVAARSGRTPGPGARGTSWTKSAVLARGRSLTLVLALKPLDAPGRVHELLLAGVEGVTLRAHLHPDLRLGRAGMDDLPAGARDVRIDVLRMNASLHCPPARSSNNTSRCRKTQNRPARSA